MSDSPPLPPVMVRSPLSGNSVSVGDVQLQEITGQAMVLVRGRKEDTKFTTEAASVLGMEFPRPRRAVEAGTRRILWMAPDQWLMRAPRAEGDEIVTSLRQVLEGCFSQVLDLTDGRAIIRVSGSGARGVLMKSTAARVAAFEAGDVARTSCAEIATMIDCRTQLPEDIFELYVFRSYAAYMWDWLEKAGRHPLSDGRRR